MKKKEKSREIVVLLFNRKKVARERVCKVLARQTSIKE
jgi:hypothetical protein